MPTERFDTVIVGGGHAGLGVAYELAAAQIDTLVLEQGGIGDSWRTSRWDAFRLNTPAWLNRLPGMPEPPDPGAFQTAPAFVAALERHAFRHRLPVRTGVRVLAVEPDGTGFRVRTDEGLIRARAVVSACGAARLPRVPALASALPRRVEQVHTARYRRPDALPPGAVLVVGGGQSGVQIAEDLRDAGRDVFLATSRVARMPRRHRGRDVLEWLAAAGHLDEPRPRPAPARTPRQAQISGTRGGHTVSYQDLERRGVVLLGRLAGVNGERIALGGDLPANLAHADEASAAIRRKIDAYIAASGADAPPAEPDPADEPYAPGALPTGPAELHLGRAGVGSVVWATGFDPDTGWLPPQALDARGEIAHADGVTPVPGLFVVGQPWMRVRRSAMIAGVAADAPHVAGLVADALRPARRLAAAA